MKTRTPSRRRNLRRNQSALQALPPIPDKQYFTIGEVSSLCAVKPHVLRYWEQEFSQLKPAKRHGNRRSYLYKDVLIARQIRKLLYDDGFTIEGARLKFLSSSSEVDKIAQTDKQVKKLIADLEGILQTLMR